MRHFLTTGLFGLLIVNVAAAEGKPWLDLGGVDGPRKGKHGVQGTGGIVAKDQENHPILRGIKSGDIFGTTDVYRVNLPLPGDSKPLVLGQVTETLKPDSKAVETKVNDPMMPVAWTKTY